jgi:hypothetical protein
MAYTIAQLYPYALAEGEGVGTAYEYAAKARFVGAVSRRLRRESRLLVAGLPERYGASLDFALLAHEAGAELLVVDEREEALERSRRSIEAAQRQGHLGGLRATHRRVESFARYRDVEPHDALLSCEVVQRVPAQERAELAETLRQLAPVGGVFAPNGENASHVKISGLGGVSLRELEALFPRPGNRFAYVDMPPFPPGISRSPEQRERAASGVSEAMAMRGLDAYCAAERFVPAFIKRHLAHIVCVSWGT